MKFTVISSIMILMATSSMASNQIPSKRQFDVEQFRRNSAAIVTELSLYLTMFKEPLMSTVKSAAKNHLGDMAHIADAAAQLFDQHVDPLSMVGDCDSTNSVSGYSATQMFQDITRNIDAIKHFYDKLEERQDESLRSKCLSEQLIRWVVANQDLSKQMLSLAESAHTILGGLNQLRDEL